MKKQYAAPETTNEDVDANSMLKLLVPMRDMIEKRLETKECGLLGGTAAAAEVLREVTEFIKKLSRKKVGRRKRR